MRHFTAVLIAIFGLGLGVSVAQANAGALERGEFYAAHGHFARAVAELTTAADHSTGYIHDLALFKRARVHLATHNYTKAVADFRAVVMARPGWEKAHSGLAWALYKTGQAERALWYALFAIELNPSDGYAVDTALQSAVAIGGDSSAARKLSEMPNYAELVADLRARWESDPDNLRLFALLANMGGVNFDWSETA